MGDDEPTRRSVLAATAGGIAALAGCNESGSTDRSTTTDTATTATETTRSTTTEAASPSVDLGFPTWTTGEKHGLVKAGPTDPPSRVWATLTRGAVTEPRFPRVDALQFRSLSYLVTGDDTVHRTFEGSGRADDDVDRSVVRTTDDALGFRHEFAGPEWTLTAEYAVHPGHEALLADVTFDAPEGYAAYLVGRPALAHAVQGDESRVDDGALGSTDDDPFLVDRAGEELPAATAIVADPGFEWTAAAPVDGDAVTDLFGRGEAVDDPPSSADGDAVLAGRLGSGPTEAAVALGFAAGTDPGPAAAEARAALEAGFDAARAAYRDSWRAYLDDVAVPDAVRDDDALAPQYAVAAMTLRAVEDETVRGAGIAAPCVPWGSVVPANDPGDVGYNFVWSRDLYQSFTATEAMGRVDDALAATEYLLTVQQGDGGFLPQNTYVDGRTRWGGEQLDNVAFPVVMAHQLRERHGVWADADYGFADLKASADYLVRSGPSTEQERWEEESGLSPSTIAAEVAGLVCAAREAEREGEEADGAVWLALADRWREGVQEWCVTREGAGGQDPPYYFRINDDRDPDDGSERDVTSSTRSLDERAIVDAGFLELVRLGILPADDPVIEHSVAVVDDAIRVETPNGPCFYRYTGDGYGTGTGNSAGAPWPAAAETKGRLWPILTGERAEYELRREGGDDPADLLDAMARFANPAGMIPEQVWDREAPTEFGWQFGEGDGSATPLSWAMAGFVRLAHGLDAGRPVETPAVVAGRYEGGPPAAPSLSVSFPDAVVEGSPVDVAGETDADRVVIRVGGDSRAIPVDSGEFDAEVALEPGRNRITVVAVGPGDRLLERGLAIERARVTRKSE